MGKKKIGIKSIIIYYILMVITGAYFVNTIVKNDSSLIIVNFLFVAIGIIALINLSFENNILGYSINTTHWLFIFIFMFLAPVTQYNNGNFPWHLVASTDELIITNILILLWCIIYAISRQIFLKRISEIKIKREVFVVIGNKLSISIIFIIDTIIFIYSINRIGFFNLFSRFSYTTSIYKEGSSIFFLFFNTSIRSIVLFSFVLILYNYKNKKSIQNLFLTLTSGGYVLLIYFPTGSGRFWVYMIYVGILIQIKGFFRNKHFLIIITIFGILYLLPFINVFRYSVMGDAGLLSSFNTDITSILTNGDFDAYSMLLRTVRYITNNSILYGHHLFGALLFFVPRALWSSKPIGSGAFIGSSQRLDFLNISSPLIAEGLINFGYLGVIIYSIIFSYISTKLDSIAIKNYYSVILKSGVNNLRLLYPFLIGFNFLILRGDFLTSFSNLVGFILPAFLITKLVSFLSLKRFDS